MRILNVKNREYKLQYSPTTSLCVDSWKKMQSYNILFASMPQTDLNTKIVFEKFANYCNSNRTIPFECILFFVL